MATLTSHTTDADTPRTRLWTFVLPALLIASIFIFNALTLHQQGRLWICKCGRVDLWAGNIWTSDNSQHIADPYSFSHIQHGLIFFALLVVVMRRVPQQMWRLLIAVLIEAAWELFENSAFVIDRYRAATVSLDYVGDTVLNSGSDVAMCMLGFWIARAIGLRRAAVLFVVIEIVMVVTIRDSLMLNIIMLIHPVDAIRNWQMVH